MTKLGLYCAFLFAAVLTAQCSPNVKDLESSAGNPPGSSAECERREKLNLNAVGAQLEFEVKNTLDVLSRYELSIDGNNDTEWENCTVSSYADGIDYWIDLRSIYPIDRIKLLSRSYWGNGAEVFVGNFTANQKKCGGSYPKGSYFNPPPLTEFNCSATYWVQNVRIRKVSAVMGLMTTLQICEVEIYYNGSKYDLKELNPRVYFEVNTLRTGSRYNSATDGILSLRSTAESSSIRQHGSIWMKVDLRNTYTISGVRLFTSEPSLYRIFLSNSTDFVNRTECKRDTSNFLEYDCSAAQTRHVLVVYEVAGRKRRRIHQMQIGEIEVFTAKSSSPPPPLCGFPPYLSKATMTTDWKTATYMCDGNLIPRTPQVITCLSSGLWSSTLLQCKPTCPNLHSPVRGGVSLPSQRVVGTIAKYSCGICYKIHGNGKRQCTLEDNGTSLKWSGSEPTCKIVHCGDPPIVEKATRSVTSKVCGGIAVYKCSEGALMFGSRHLICSPEGKWLGTLPVCAHVPHK